MELFRLLGTIAINNDAANKALEDTSQKAKTSSQETQDAFAKIGGVATKVASGIATAGAALGGAWMAAIEGTREYRTQMGMLEATFQTNKHSTESAKKTFTELNAVLGDSGQATEAAQHLALLTDNEKELQTWTDICTGVYATFGESLPIEGLTEAANHTAKIGEVQGSLADALEWSGISVDEFNEQLAKCSTEQERQKLITDTLNKTYKASSDQYKKTNKDVMDAEKAQQKLTDAMAELGKIGEPILTAIKTKVAEMASAAIPHLENFVNKVKDVAKWVKDNQDTIDKWVAVILGAGTSIGTFLLILNWGTIMTAAANAIKVVRTAILGMNAAMLANPIALIVAALVGLVVAFVYLWNNVEGFRAFWIKVWEAVKSAASTAWKFISNTFSNIGSWFKEKFQQVQKWGKDAMDKTKQWFVDTYKKITSTFSNIGGWFRDKFRSAWSSIKSVFSGWGTFFGGLWTQIKSKFSSIGSSLGTSMGNAVKSGLNKALTTIEKAINKGIGLINSAIALANKLPGVNVGKVSKISLPRLARGGVLEKGQIGLLEGSGAEAVVPLEHNRAWLSRVAEDLHEMQSNNNTTSTQQLERLLKQVVLLLEQPTKQQIVLDSGVLVGELVPAIDGRMATKLSHIRRGNVR